MGWTLSIIVAVLAVALLFAAALLNKKRGIGKISFIPWDYVMILAAFVLLAICANMALLWRNGTGL